MKIKIAARLRPYSHLAGTYCLLPGTPYRLQLFPTKIVIHDLTKAEPQFIKELPIPFEGPVKEFTVTSDLEKKSLEVWGHSESGFFKFWVVSEGNEVVIVNLLKNQISELERLSLGCNKAQDWEQVHRRSNLDEIFPHWFQLAQLTPEVPKNAWEGTATLLHSCHGAIESGFPERILPQFQKVYKTGFYGLLVPRLRDEQFQGIMPDEPILNFQLSPLILLTEGAKLIRELFIAKGEGVVKILPHLPPEFHCGRMTNVKIGSGAVDIEWTKKRIRTLIFTAAHDDELSFVYKHIKNFRFRDRPTGKGVRLENGALIKFETSKQYFFDNFQE